jgi:NADH dehydrogenase
MSRRVVAVSGATGFLGSALCRSLARHGFEVRALARDPTRRPAGIESLGWYRFGLPDETDASAFQGADVFVHCAYDTRVLEETRAWAVNVEGSQRAFRSARQRGVGRIVFISSMSAHPEAESIYGRSKLAVEALLDPKRDLTIRPGHILGEGGVFWRTAASIAALPLIPLFFGGEQRLQTIHVEDVCEGIRRAIEAERTGTLLLAERDPVSLRELLAATARALGKRPRFLRLPGGIALPLLQAAENLGLSLPLSSDNLRGLRRLRAFEVAADLRGIGLSPRAMHQSLAEIRWNGLARR